MGCGSRGEGMVAVVGRKYALPRATVEVRLKVGLTTVEIRLAPPRVRR